MKLEKLITGQFSNQCSRCSGLALSILTYSTLPSHLYCALRPADCQSLKSDTMKNDNRIRSACPSSLAANVLMGSCTIIFPTPQFASSLSPFTHAVPNKHKNMHYKVYVKRKKYLHNISSEETRHFQHDCTYIKYVIKSGLHTSCTSSPLWWVL